MQIWQMDVMTGVLLDDGTELKIVTGLDDHSRFCVAAGLVRRKVSPEHSQEFDEPKSKRIPSQRIHAQPGTALLFNDGHGLSPCER